jgi:hypothetical protein
MELRELLALDAESLTAAQAQQVVKDVIEVSSRGVQASDQEPLRALLIRAQEITTGRKIGDQHDTIRQDVLTKIQEAEARGDKRTARYLAEAMGKADVIAADLAEKSRSDEVQKYIEKDLAESEARGYVARTLVTASRKHASRLLVTLSVHLPTRTTSTN